MLGQRQSCELALSAAESHLGRIETTDVAIELSSPTQFSRLAGSCYLFLKDAKRAQRILEEAAKGFQGKSKPQAIVLGNLTLAYLSQGKLEEAAARLHEAIDVVELTRGGGGLNVVFSAGRKLRPWRHVPAVQDVSDRLLSLIAAA
jgi:hypothetical protein